MKKTITINVTQEHINLGKPGTAHDCAIALALKEQLEVKTVHVDISRINLYPYGFGDFPLSIRKLPKKVVNFIEIFDKMDKTKSKPFSFRLPIQNQVQNQVKELVLT